MDWNGLADKSFWRDQQRIIFNRDCRRMVDLPDETVQLVVTSPPYWGLRKYSGEQELVWGDNHCKHRWEASKGPTYGRNDSGEYQGRHDGIVGITKGLEAQTISSSNFCSLCGDWKGAFGLEPTPEMYVQHTVEILREIRRVLRKDGVVFWNVGDSYAGSNSGKGDYREKKGLQKDIYDYEHPQANAGKWDKWRRGVGGEAHGVSLSGMPIPSNLKPKDLCLIPFRVAIALQEDGWWVRSVIIWNKPNPMPESVTDRPTESHEYILMLTKSAKYYWDADAVREGEGRRYTEFFRRGNTYTQGRAFDARSPVVGRGGEVYDDTIGRNIRTVWTFPTQPYPEAHFAVFPEKLPETCIKAASKESDIVLDPFAGAGTTLKVAANLNRRAIGYELSKEYCRLIIDRNRQSVLKLEV